MKTCKWNKLNIETSLLGFGCMRLPSPGDDKIDFEEAQKLIDTAMAAGVNYYDTAYGYHNGESEIFVGQALAKYPRESYYLATKLPCWLVKTKEDVRRLFEEQSQKLQKDYVDFYLLHALTGERWREMQKLGVVEECEKLRAEGKIRYLGFSFHDDYAAFEEILTAYDWDFCQIQYNYMDIDEQAGDKGYALCVERDIPVIVMEPVRGGALANLPESITAPFKAECPDASVASWALRWVGSRPQVKVILSGMSNAEQVADNLHTFGDFCPLSEKEEQIVASVREALFSRVQNGCTACRYCMPCPAGVDIPGNFRMWNTYHIYENAGGAKWRWNSMDTSARADKCVECGQCETLCPQHIAIRADLKRVCADISKLFEGEQK